MSKPIALQLYTIREHLDHDYEAGVEQVAKMGYAGVETAGFPGTTPEKAVRLFDDLGLKVCSAHVPLPNKDNKNEVLDAAAAIRTPRLISGLGADHYQTKDSVRKACDQFNQAAEIAREAGLKFGIHNHWWEFQPVEGTLGLDLLLENLDPDVFFQIDTYWVKTAGQDPVEVIGKLGPRAPLLHIKDGPATEVVELPMVAVGEGTMNFADIVAAAEEDVEWLIVELDRCATDMMEAVEKSYQYLTGKGWGHGTR